MLFVCRQMQLGVHQAQGHATSAVPPPRCKPAVARLQFCFGGVGVGAMFGAC